MVSVCGCVSAEAGSVRTHAVTLWESSAAKWTAVFVRSGSERGASDQHWTNFTRSSGTVWKDERVLSFITHCETWNEGIYLSSRLSASVKRKPSATLTVYSYLLFYFRLLWDSDESFILRWHTETYWLCVDSRSLFQPDITWTHTGLQMIFGVIFIRHSLLWFSDVYCFFTVILYWFNRF